MWYLIVSIPDLTFFLTLIENTQDLIIFSTELTDLMILQPVNNHMSFVVCLYAAAYTGIRSVNRKILKYVRIHYTNINTSDFFFTVF